MGTQKEYVGAEVRRICVLIVDDEPELRKILQSGLLRVWASTYSNDGDLSVEAVGSVDEATELLKTKSFACAVVDIELGRGGDSSALCVALNKKGIPFLRMSGNYDALDSLPETLQGSEKLRKPFNLADITRAVRQHMRTSTSC